jgi:hypothetical protein
VSLFRPIRNLFTVLFWRAPPDPVALAHVKFRRGRYVRGLWVSPDLKKSAAGQISILLGSIDTREIEEQEGVAPEFCSNAWLSASAFRVPTRSANRQATDSFPIGSISPSPRCDRLPGGADSQR